MRALLLNSWLGAYKATPFCRPGELWCFSLEGQTVERRGLPDKLVCDPAGGCEGLRNFSWCRGNMKHVIHCTCSMYLGIPWIWLGTWNTIHSTTIVFWLFFDSFLYFNIYFNVLQCVSSHGISPLLFSSYDQVRGASDQQIQSNVEIKWLVSRWVNQSLVFCWTVLELEVSKIVSFFCLDSYVFYI